MALGEKRGCLDQVTRIMQSKKKPYEITQDLAKLLRCLTPAQILTTVRKIPLHSHAHEVVKQLKERRVKTAVVTDSYLLVAKDLQKRLGIDYAYANKLIIEDGHITGEITLQNPFPEKKYPGCRQHSICKGNILQSLANKLGITSSEIMAIGDGEVDICMLQKAGIGIAFRAPEKVRKEADMSIDDLKVLLDYI
jgi:phosphoserine phosphatase